MIARSISAGVGLLPHELEDFVNQTAPIKCINR